MRVAVVAEYYPRRRDPASGVWAHRQALAARAAGADMSVLVLERPLPGAEAARALARGRAAPAVASLRAAYEQPRRDRLDGIDVEYVRFVSPPRERSYATWHRWARRPLERALEHLHAREPLDLVHAHYALPAGGAAAAWARRNALPLVVSVHGGDLLAPLLSAPPARASAAAVLRAARVVIANSAGMLERAAALAGSAERMRVIHPPGQPPPPQPPPKRARPTVATVGNLDPRKRHADVLEALARVPDAGWLVIGDGPERAALEARAAELGLENRVEWAGALAPRDAVAALATCHAMAMPSVDEAFGVAYAEALACGLPAIGCAGEPGPEDLAGLTEAMILVPPRDPAAIAEAIERALGASALEDAARTVGLALLEECGPRTLDAYRDALA
ncbi:MAG TPA: glycosyltransferase [Thermoleophilaceae bacterium]|jgi:glycosyltransferase involved in cell wall biosynthesis